MGEEFKIYNGRLVSLLNTRLSEYRVPEGVRSIDALAFEDCKAMRKLFISSTVSEFDTSIFIYDSLYEKIKNPNFEEIEVDGKNPYFRSVGGVLFTKDMSRLLLFPTKKKCDSYTVPDSVREIGASAFCGAKYLKKLTLPASLSSVEFGAFTGCEAITELRLPSSLSSLSDLLFKGMNSLEKIEADALSAAYKSVDGVLFSKDGKRLVAYPVGKKNPSYSVPSGVEVIANKAFLGAKNLKSISCPFTLREIEADAFSDCSSLSRVELAKGLKKIWYRAFDYCHALSEITLPASIEFIGNGAFSECHSLKKFEISGYGLYIRVDNGVLFSGKKLIAYPPARPGAVYTVPQGTREIEAYAFRYAGHLKKVIMPSSVIKCGSGAFSGCGKLTEIELSQGLENIEFGLFENCRNLEKVIIPEGVREIEISAFSGCKGLSELRIPSSIEKLDSFHFEDCGALKSITLPKRFMDRVKDIFRSSYRPGSAPRIHFI